MKYVLRQWKHLVVGETLLSITHNVYSNTKIRLDVSFCSCC